MFLKKLLTFTFLLAGLAFMVKGQQVPDLDFQASIEYPRYKSGTGPVIGIDGGHNNLHQLGGGFAPFAKLVREDGYAVKAIMEFGSEQLDSLDILLIVNALHVSNIGNWQNPVPSAFAKAEIDSLEQWVQKGGKLWVIADHMPFGGAAADLAKKFGFSFENGFAMGKSQSWPPERYTKQDATLFENALTEGVDTLAGFTGSALKSPEGAIVAGKFPDTHQLLLPEVAWQFDEKTEVHPLNDYVIGAVKQHGQGKVAFFTEAAMFTAQIVQEKFKVGFNSPMAPYNQRFALNVLHWLDGEPATAAIKHLLKAQAAAFEKNDLEAVASHYTHDGIIYEPTGKEIVGKAAITQYWQKLAGRAQSWETQILDIEIIGEQVLAICQFDIRFKNADGKTITARSKAMITFKKENGQYKIHRDFYVPLRS